jgi:uncharacterized protein
MKSSILIFASAILVPFLTGCSGGSEQTGPGAGNNFAIVANATMSGRPSPSISTLNDGITVKPDAAPGTRPNAVNIRPGTQWFQYDWTQPIITGSAEVYFWADQRRSRLPKSYRLLYWNDSTFVPVENAAGLGIAADQFNKTTFKEVKTSKLRLEITTDSTFPAGVLEWIVYGSKNSPDIAPIVNAGIDRSVITGGKTYLAATVKSVRKPKKTGWKMDSGPGTVTFENPSSAITSATFSTDGEYVLTFTAGSGNLKSSSSLNVKVVQPPAEKRLDVVYTKRYKIDSPLWNARAKAIIVNWIPHCIDMIERTDLKIGPGGIDNFIEAGKALRGEKHGRHLGYVFSNAWVHQTIESMCIALMVDPQGDKEIIAAQEKMKRTLEKWIPVILAAQEPDGYLQTAFTLRDTAQWKERWAPATRGNHEGYVSGYFIESAINHYTLTEGKDLRLYSAAKKLADCWVANIGPGKKEWFDGHQEMEQALVRFGRFVNDVEGNGKGDSYIALAKFLLDCRKNGTEYDQSHVPVQQQYEAVGHAVRAAYNYSAMADVAAETGDIDYESAVMSLWDNMVNKKYYITGGIGSGETSEGFGPNYSLRNNAYCESCSSCGLIFFQYKMNLAYHDAKYADLYEETMYNALLGALDLDGKNFTYTNELNSSHSRYEWHTCPCCVGNIPRTLLMVPTWTYVRGESGVYVNMFIGSSIKVEKVAGTDLEMVQKTDYPWSGNIAITVNPAESKEFTVFVRIPDRTTSELYTPVPEVKGYKSIKVNGEPISPEVRNGYAEIRRTWKAGDKIEMEIPMEVQKVTAIEQVTADKDRVAFRFGPLVYNVETIDQKNIDQPVGSAPLISEFRKDLLGGVMTIKGNWSDGSTLLAIPNYARNNRNSGPVKQGEQGSVVWIKAR